MAKNVTETPTDWNDWEPGTGQIKGGQHSLDRPIPPMIHGQMGYPMIDRDHVDWERVIDEQNKKDGIEMKPIKPILKAKHRKNCGAVAMVEKGTWEHPWGFTETVWANKFANQTQSRNGQLLWLKARCNDTSCPAEIWVPSDDFLTSLPNGI